jgi:hypothetical protein
MFDLSKAEDLVKASRSIGGVLAKQAEEMAKTQLFHDNLSKQNEVVATQHEALKKAHEESSAAHAEAVEKMDDTHELKAYHKSAQGLDKRAAEMHDQLSKAHKEMATAYKASADAAKSAADALKNAAAEWGAVAGTVTKTAVTKTAGGDPAVAAAGSVEELMQSTMTKLLEKTFQTLEGSPDVQKRIEDVVLKAIGEKLGDKIVPTGVHAINRSAGMLIQRTGNTGSRTGTDDSPVVPQLTKMVQFDD